MNFSDLEFQYVKARAQSFGPLAFAEDAGSAWAVGVAGVSVPGLNRLFLRDDQADVDELRRRFSERGLSPLIDRAINFRVFRGEVGEKTEFWNSATRSHDRVAYSDMYLRAWEITGPGREAVRSAVRRWFDMPGWEMFSTDAGVAVLFVHSKIAYLADAAVLPTARGRGVHRELIEARLARAAELGCSTVFSRSESLASIRNLQRCGLTEERCT